MTIFRDFVANWYELDATLRRLKRDLEENFPDLDTLKQNVDEGHTSKRDLESLLVSVNESVTVGRDLRDFIDGFVGRLRYIRDDTSPIIDDLDLYAVMVMDLIESFADEAEGLPADEEVA